MDQIKVLDKTFKKFIHFVQIQEAIARIAAEIDRELYGKNPLFLGVLNGVFIFAGDLFKMIQTPCSISFVKMASYLGTESTGKVHQLIGLQEDLTDRHVVILEDIIDSGLTIEMLLEHLNNHHTASVRIASLFFKPKAFKGHFSIDHIGIEIPNEFVLGYGLDYNGFGRNYRDLYVVTKDEDELVR